jgi:hypothetical protein
MKSFSLKSPLIVSTLNVSKSWLIKQAFYAAVVNLFQDFYLSGYTTLETFEIFIAIDAHIQKKIPE